MTTALSNATTISPFIPRTTTRSSPTPSGQWATSSSSWSISTPTMCNRRGSISTRARSASTPTTSSRCTTSSPIAAMCGRAFAISCNSTQKECPPTCLRCGEGSAPRRALAPSADPHDPGGIDAWYHDAVIYEVHVRAFADANSDGIGELKGLTSKLDYLRDLGVTALWLLPFYPSPLRDDGYDIADYRGVHPNYGTLHDAKTFLHEAHQRGLRVITELVLNHTSDQHPWFQAARRAPAGSAPRDFYVWSETNQKYQGGRMIFTDTEMS